MIPYCSLLWIVSKIIHDFRVLSFAIPQFIVIILSRSVRLLLWVIKVYLISLFLGVPQYMPIRAGALLALRTSRYA